MNQTHRPAILIKETVWLFWQQIKHDKRRFFIMLIFIPLAALILDTAIPYLLSLAVGTFADHQLATMSLYLWWAAACVVVGVALNLVGFHVAIRHESEVRRKLTTATLESLLAKDQTFFANQKIGSLTGKYLDFINAHVGLQDLFVLRTLSFVINLVVGVIIIYLQTPLLAWIIIGLLIGLAVQIRYFRKLRETIRAERKRLIAEVNGTVADILTNYLTVKTFAKEKDEVQAADTISAEYQKATGVIFPGCRWRGRVEYYSCKQFKLSPLS